MGNIEYFYPSCYLRSMFHMCVKSKFFSSPRSHVKPSRRLLFQLAECLDSKNVTALAAILSKQSSYTGSLEVDL